MAQASQAGTRAAAVAAQLRESIFAGKLPPGSPLRELALARELNVSQATVRDALQRLESAGLVTRRPNVGTTVTQLSPKDVRERVRLRVVLETLAAEQAAPRMTPADFRELERRLKTLSAAVHANRYYEAAQADLDFHRHIWQCSGDETLCRTLELITVPLFAFISILRSHGLQRLSAVVAEHRPIVAALAGKNPKQLRAAIRTGATSSYEPFLGIGQKTTVAAAFGFLKS